MEGDSNNSNENDDQKREDLVVSDSGDETTQKKASIDENKENNSIPEIEPPPSLSNDKMSLNDIFSPSTKRSLDHDDFLDNPKSSIQKLM